MHQPDQRLEHGVRIGLIVGGFPTLSETFILDHITGLLRRGHDVQIVAESVAGTDPIHADVGRFDLISRTHYRLSRSQPLSRQLGNGVSSGVALLRGHPGAVARLLTTSTDTGARRRRAALRDMLAITRIDDMDLYHAHFGPVGANLVEVLDVLGDDTPVVSTFHGFDLTQYVKSHGTECYARLFERGTLFLPVSSFFRGRLIELGAPPERTIVHHMGVDVARFSLRSDRSTGEGSLRILTIGRMVEKKGIEYALRAVAVALRGGVPLTYTIIGDGSYRSELEEMAAQLDIADNVRFLGRMDRDEVIRYLRQNDVLLAPSVTARNGDMEGIPVAIMEALASGVTVISSKHSGIPEIVVHGETGLLADERDSVMLGDHIVRLAQDPVERRRLADNGRQLVKRDFEIEQLNDGIVKLYDAVLAGRYIARSPRICGR